MTKTIFITGASRGLGRIWLDAFLKNGYNVAVAVRTPESLKELSNAYPSTLKVYQLDVTDKKKAFDVVSQAKEHFGNIDVLINNAGYGHMGAIEELTEDEIKLQLNTNVLGLLWVTQAVLPIMREQKSGHIIQISSAMGLVTLPTMGLYSATKFAVEAIGESLAYEVAGFGIKVTIVEPNGFDTDFGNSSLVQSNSNEAYDGVRKALYEQAAAQETGDPSATANAMITLVEAENPPLRLMLGKVAFPWIKHTYDERLKTWNEWQEVSVAAHGKK